MHYDVICDEETHRHPETHCFYFLHFTTRSIVPLLTHICPPAVFSIHIDLSFSLFLLSFFPSFSSHNQLSIQPTNNKPLHSFPLDTTYISTMCILLWTLPNNNHPRFKLQVSFSFSRGTIMQHSTQTCILIQTCTLFTSLNHTIAPSQVIETSSWIEKLLARISGTSIRSCTRLKAS